MELIGYSMEIPIYTKLACCKVARSHPPHMVKDGRQTRWYIKWRHPWDFKTNSQRKHTNIWSESRCKNAILQVTTVVSHQNIVAGKFIRDEGANLQGKTVEEMELEEFEAFKIFRAMRKIAK